MALAHEDDDKQSDLQQALPPVTVAGAAPRVALPADGWFYGYTTRLWAVRQKNKNSLEKFSLGAPYIGVTPVQCVCHCVLCAAVAGAKVPVFNAFSVHTDLTREASHCKSPMSRKWLSKV